MIVVTVVLFINPKMFPSRKPIPHVILPVDHPGLGWRQPRFRHQITFREQEIIASLNQRFSIGGFWYH